MKISNNDPSIIENKLAIEPNSINNWLSLHPGKCKSMLFASKCKSKNVSDFRVVLNGITINS